MKSDEFTAKFGIKIRRTTNPTIIGEILVKLLRLRNMRSVSTSRSSLALDKALCALIKMALSAMMIGHQ